MAVSSTTKSYSAINLFESTLINATLLVDQMTNNDMVSAHKFTCRLQEHLMESLNKWVESDSRGEKSNVTCANSTAAAAAIYNQASIETTLLKRANLVSNAHLAMPRAPASSSASSLTSLPSAELDSAPPSHSMGGGADAFKAPPGKRSKLSTAGMINNATSAVPVTRGSVAMPSESIGSSPSVPSSLQQLQEQLLEQQQRQQQEFRVLQHQRDLQQQQSQMQQMAQLQKQQLQIQQLLAMHKQQAAAAGSKNNPSSQTPAEKYSKVVSSTPNALSHADFGATDDFGSDEYADEFDMDEDEYDSDGWCDDDEDGTNWGASSESIVTAEMSTTLAARRRTRQDKERDRQETLEKLQQVQLARSCDLDETEDNEEELAGGSSLSPPGSGPVTVRIGRSATNFAEKLPYDRALAYLMVSGCTMSVTNGLCHIYTSGFGLEFVSNGRCCTVLVAFSHINSLFYNTNNLPSLFISMSERDMEGVCAALGTTFHAGQPKMVVGLTAPLDREALDSIQRHYETNPSRRFFKMDPPPSGTATAAAAAASAKDAVA